MTSSVVVDASTLVDALLPGRDRDTVRESMGAFDAFAGPEHLGIEVLNVLRRLARRQHEPSPALHKARSTLVQLHIELVPLAALHDRIWQLRDTLTAYDAAYAATAEHLRIPLLTSDHAFAKHPNLRCTIIDPRGGRV